MKRYKVILTTEKIIEAYIEANDENEAKIKAMEWNNLKEEETREEIIKSVDDIKEDNIW